MKHLKSAVLFLFVVASCARLINAQNTITWVEVSREDELFLVSMPNEPKAENQEDQYGGLKVNGKRYTSVADGASYTVWSLVNVNYRSVQPSDADAYLDACADLVWESLLKPAKDKLSKEDRGRATMTYEKELPAKPLTGREYSIALKQITGTIRFYVADARVYVLLAMNSLGGPWERERFFQSFAMKPGPPGPATLDADPSLIGKPIGGSGGAASSDYDRVFAVRDTTERARILAKPEPHYTESARKYGVQGTVVLRAVLSREGRVTNIRVVRKLPHGLTESAILAAQHIEFTPASKDGQPVAQWIQLEYNFNLY